MGLKYTLGISKQNSNFPLVSTIREIIAKPFCTFLCCQSNSEAFAERTESSQSSQNTEEVEEEAAMVVQEEAVAAGSVALILLIFIQLRR